MKHHPQNKSEDKTSSKATDSQSQTVSEVLRELSPYLNIGWTFLISILLFALGGYFADKHWTTFPWLTLVGSILGITIGFYQFFRTVLRNSDKNKQL